MTAILYNDMQFTLRPSSEKWDLLRTLPDGSCTLVGAGLFPGQPAAAAQLLAQTLIHTLFPVGVHIIGPDVEHPNSVGELKIVGVNVAHPNFVYWTGNSTSLQGAQHEHQ